MLPLAFEAFLGAKTRETEETCYFTDVCHFTAIESLHLPLQRPIVVIKHNDHIAYVEYVADQLGKPDYTTATQALRQAA